MDAMLNGDTTLPPVARKGWVVIHHAEPATRELNMQSLEKSGGMLCMAELRHGVITFYEGVSGMTMNRVFAIEVASFKAWSQETTYAVYRRLKVFRKYCFFFVSSKLL